MLRPALWTAFVALASLAVRAEAAITLEVRVDAEVRADVAVHIGVRNVGDEPATFSDEHQRAYGENDEEFAADSGAGVLANDQQQIFLNKINPGNQVTGIVVYDIPPDASIVKIELRASEGSTGALVRTR